MNPPNVITPVVLNGTSLKKLLEVFDSASEVKIHEIVSQCFKSATAFTNTVDIEADVKEIASGVSNGKLGVLIGTLILVAIKREDSEDSVTEKIKLDAFEWKRRLLIIVKSCLAGLRGIIGSEKAEDRIDGENVRIIAREWVEIQTVEESDQLYFTWATGESPVSFFKRLEDEATRVFNIIRKASVGSNAVTSLPSFNFDGIDCRDLVEFFLPERHDDIVLYDALHALKSDSTWDTVQTLRKSMVDKWNLGIQFEEAVVNFFSKIKKPVKAEIPGAPTSKDKLAVRRALDICVGIGKDLLNTNPRTSPIEHHVFRTGASGYANKIRTLVGRAFDPNNGLVNQDEWNRMGDIAAKLDAGASEATKAIKDKVAPESLSVLEPLSYTPRKLKWMELDNPGMSDLIAQVEEMIRGRNTMYQWFTFYGSAGTGKTNICKTLASMSAGMVHPIPVIETIAATAWKGGIKGVFDPLIRALDTVFRHGWIIFIDEVEDSKQLTKLVTEVLKPAIQGGTRIPRLFLTAANVPAFSNTLNTNQNYKDHAIVPAPEACISDGVAQTVDSVRAREIFTWFDEADVVMLENEITKQLIASGLKETTRKTIQGEVGNLMDLVKSAYKTNLSGMKDITKSSEIILRSLREMKEFDGVWDAKLIFRRGILGPLRSRVAMLEYQYFLQKEAASIGFVFERQFDNDAAFEFLHHKEWMVNEFVAIANTLKLEWKQESDGARVAVAIGVDKSFKGSPVAENSLHDAMLAVLRDDRRLFYSSELVNTSLNPGEYEQQRILQLFGDILNVNGDTGDSTRHAIALHYLTKDLQNAQNALNTYHRGHDMLTKEMTEVKKLADPSASAGDKVTAGKILEQNRAVFEDARRKIALNLSKIVLKDLLVQYSTKSNATKFPNWSASWIKITNPLIYYRDPISDFVDETGALEAAERASLIASTNIQQTLPIGTFEPQSRNSNFGTEFTEQKNAPTVSDNEWGFGTLVMDLSDDSAVIPVVKYDPGVNESHNPIVGKKAWGAGDYTTVKDALLGKPPLDKISPEISLRITKTNEQIRSKAQLFDIAKHVLTSCFVRAFEEHASGHTKWKDMEKKWAARMSRNFAIETTKLNNFGMGILISALEDMERKKALLTTLQTETWLVKEPDVSKVAKARLFIVDFENEMNNIFSIEELANFVKTWTKDHEIDLLSDVQTPENIRVAISEITKNADITKNEDISKVLIDKWNNEVAPELNAIGNNVFAPVFAKFADSDDASITKWIANGEGELRVEAVNLVFEATRKNARGFPRGIVCDQRFQHEIYMRYTERLVISNVLLEYAKPKTKLEIKAWATDYINKKRDAWGLSSVFPTERLSSIAEAKYTYGIKLIRGIAAEYIISKKGDISVEMWEREGRTFLLQYFESDKKTKLLDSGIKRHLMEYHFEKQIPILSVIEDVMDKVEKNEEETAWRNIDRAPKETIISQTFNKLEDSEKLEKKKKFVEKISDFVFDTTSHDVLDTLITWQFDIRKEIASHVAYISDNKLLEGITTITALSGSGALLVKEIVEKIEFKCRGIRGSEKDKARRSRLEARIVASCTSSLEKDQLTVVNWMKGSEISTESIPERFKKYVGTANKKGLLWKMRDEGPLSDTIPIKNYTFKTLEIASICDAKEWESSGKEALADFVELNPAFWPNGIASRDPMKIAIDNLWTFRLAILKDESFKKALDEVLSSQAHDSILDPQNKYTNLSADVRDCIFAIHAEMLELQARYLSIILELPEVTLVTSTSAWNTHGRGIVEKLVVSRGNVPKTYQSPLINHLFAGVLSVVEKREKAAPAIIAPPPQNIKFDFAGPVETEQDEIVTPVSVIVSENCDAFVRDTRELVEKLRDMVNSAKIKIEKNPGITAEGVRDIVRYASTTRISYTEILFNLIISSQAKLVSAEYVYSTQREIILSEVSRKLGITNRDAIDILGTRADRRFNYEFPQVPQVGGKRVKLQSIKLRKYDVSRISTVMDTTTDSASRRRISKTPERATPQKKRH